MKYTDNNLTVAGKGKGFESFRKSFGNDDRGYGYIRIMGGDELSKRPKFIFVTWCGESVPAMQKVISIQSIVPTLLLLCSLIIPNNLL